MPATRAELARMTEEDLFERARAGAGEALAILVERTRATALRVAKRACHDADLAEDAVQEAFIAAVDRVAAAPAGESFESWFCKLVKTRAETQAARAERYEDHDALEDTDIAVEPAPSSEKRLDRGEATATLASRLAVLTSREREVYEAHVQGGRTLPEIARAYGMRLRDVQNAWDRVRRRALGNSAGKS